MQHHIAQPLHARRDRPGKAGGEGVARSKGDVVATVVLLAIQVAAEGGLRVAIRKVDIERTPRLELHGHLATKRAGATGVGHHATRSRGIGQDRQLLIAAVDHKEGKVATNRPLGTREVASHLVIPTVFGVVGHDILLLISATHGLCLKHLLQHVGVDLRVESARLEATREGGIEVAVLVEAVDERQFRQNLREVLLVAAFGLQHHGLLLHREGHGTHLEGIFQRARSVRVKAYLLMLDAHTRLGLKLAETQARLMVGGKAVGRRVKLRVERHILQGMHLHATSRSLVGGGEDHRIDTCRLEDHGSLHLLVAVETVETEEVVVAAIALRAEDHIFGYDVLLDLLLQREVIEGREVVVEEHIIVRELVGGDRGQRVAIRLVLDRQSIAQRHSVVAARVVVGDPARRYGIAVGVRDTLRATPQKGVGITALLRLGEREGILDAQPLVVAEEELPATAVVLLPIRIGTRQGVPKEAVRGGAVGRNGGGPLVVELLVERGAQAEGVSCAVTQLQVGALVVEGREGIDIHHATHRVTPIEGRLRATQHLHALDIRELHVEGVFLHQGYVVDRHTHHGLIDAGTQATHIDRRGHARTVVGDVEVGNHLGQVLQGRDLVA